jgi:VWFA-related protein
MSLRAASRGRVVVALWVTLAAALAAGAPGQPPTPPARTPVFRTGVDLLVVEATVVDSSGNVARGLTARDFRVEIGGKPREVASAEFVEYDEEPPADEIDAEVTTNEERPSRAVLLVVDQSSLQFDRRGALAGAKRWLATLAPGDRLGFLGVPAPGPMVEFTTEHAKVLAAFDQLKAGVGPTMVPYVRRNVALWEAFQITERNDAVFAAVVSRECGRMDPTCISEIRQNANAMAQDSFERVRPVLEALERVFQGLAAMPGPKHVVLVSSGWPMEERRAIADITTLAARASLANTTVHVFTAEEWAMAASSRSISPQRTLDQNLMLQSVETLAAYTGGRAVRLAGNGEAAFTSLNRGLTGYYRLAVRPALEDLDGNAKRINVDVTRGGLSVAGHRRVMVGTRPATTTAAAAPAAAPGDGAATGADCRASVRRAIENGTRHTALGLKTTSYVMHGDEPSSVRVAVIGSVTRAAEGQANVVAVLFDRSGRPARGTEQDVRVLAASAGRVMTTLPVPPGEYVLRLVACDAEGRLGSIERAVNATWQDVAGTGVTGLVLFRALGGPRGELQPVLDEVTTRDQIVAQLPIDGAPDESKVKVTYEIASGESASPLRLTGRLGKTSTGALVDEAVVTAGTLPPGTYTISAIIGAGTAPVSRRSFRVVAPAK